MNNKLLSWHCHVLFLLFAFAISATNLAHVAAQSEPIPYPTSPLDLEGKQQEFGAVGVVQDSSAPQPDQWELLNNQITELSDKLSKLEKGMSESKEGSKKQSDKKENEKKDAKPAKEPPPKDKWNVKLGGHFQLDYINWANADANIPSTQNYTNFRRARLVADGVGYDTYDFRLQMTLEPDADPIPGLTSTGLLRDAYFSINEIPLLGRFRIGNFFVPFSLEQVTNDTNNIFLERSIPTQGVFSPEREVGVALYNSTDDQRAHWAYGIFVDSLSEGAKKKFDDNQGLRLSGRFTFLPYWDECAEGKRLIHTGAGILYTHDSDNSVRFRARPQISEGPRLIDTGAIGANEYTTGNIEGAIVWDQFSIQSEAFLSSVNLLAGPQTTINGSYVYFSWFLTGESRVYEKFGQHGAQFGRNKPKNNFLAKKGHFQPGAWELKTRWSHLDLNNLNAGQYNDMTTGFNWYLSDRVRMMFDWIHPFTSAGAVVPNAEADILAMRWDVNW